MSQNLPNLNRRVLRSRTVPVNSPLDVGSAPENSSKKRKATNWPESNPVIRRGRQPEQARESLQDVGLKLGPKTRRERIIDLLDHHVIRKRTRLTNNTSAPNRSQTSTNENQPTLEDAGNNPVMCGDIDWSKFSNMELVEMLRGVGLEMASSDTASLVKTCKIYQDLIIIPPASSDTSGQLKFDFTFGQAEQLHAGHGVIGSNDRDLMIRPPELHPSTLPHQSSSTLPSREHGRTTFPRQPTGKGKGKAKACISASSESEWDSDEDMEEEDEESSDADVDEDMGEEQVDIGASDQVNRVGNESGAEEDQPAPRSAVASIDQLPSPVQSPRSSTFGSRINDPHQFDYSFNTGTTDDRLRNLGNRVNELKASNACLEKMLAKSDQRIDVLTSKLQSLTQIVKKHIDNNTGLSPQKKKVRGGRTSARIRFHVETLCGQKSQVEAMPPPATSAEKERWNYDTDLDAVNIDPNFILIPDDDNDPRFPIKDGPGHRASTPQQLSIIKQMMDAAGLSTFRPDFEKGANSPDNKWLWDVALKIFIKLVELGEYTGVSLDTDNRAYIKKCFDTHIQSLMGRYRRDSWSEARKNKAAGEKRRHTRRNNLVINRSKILVQEEIWPLLAIVETTCSDDETDQEVELNNNTTRRPAVPCQVRQSPWRSDELGTIWTLVDQVKAKFDKSVSGSSPARGRKARPRVRGLPAPESKIEPPSGLSIDCLKQSWVGGLNPTTRLALQINPTPILPEIRSTLEQLLQN